MPNFSSLAGLEVAEKFVWGGVGVVGIFMSNPTVVLRLGWGFDNYTKKQGMMSQTGVITFPTFNDTDFNIVIQIEESSLLLCHFEGS